MEQNKESLTGSVDNIIYHNDENGYTVCELQTDDDYITIVGTLPFISVSDHLTVYGNWVNHPSYGKQFKVEYFEKQLPEGEKNILKYLSSGAIKGIGPKTAAKIVEKFGDDTFDVLENHPDWLTQITGITAKKAATICENYKLVSGAKNVIMFCNNFFGTAISLRIYKQWGGQAVDRIKENPYKLCTEFDGITFKRADQIATTIGLPKDSKDRIAGGIIYDLTLEASKKGNTCINKDRLISDTAKILDVSTNAVSDELENQIALGTVIINMVENETLISLPDYYNAEKNIAKKLIRINQKCPKINKTDIQYAIQSVEAQSGLQYNIVQKEAIATALTEGVMILTGGPGTGKTTTIKALITIFQSLDMKVALAAPTGRAAKRMSESTQTEAQTIHRLLEMEFNSGEKAIFARNESQPLSESVFIIDESSMIDVLLLDALLKAIRIGSKIIFIGDRDQLPSVSAGNTFADIIDSNVFKTIELTKIYRQEENSLIISNAHAINSGIYPITNNKCNDFFLLQRQYEESIPKSILDLITERLPKAYGKIDNKIQIITPSHKGIAGTVELNNLIQNALNPPSNYKAEKKHKDITFREGDKVMQVKNNYSIEWEKYDIEGIGLFNGEIGIIKEIRLNENYMVIDFDEKIVNYDFDFLDELELAYAITVHKSQGCEYPIVIIPLYQCPPILLTRNLLYTAVTRAEKMVILIGKEEILHKMVDNNYHSIRLTQLKNNLQKA